MTTGSGEPCIPGGQGDGLGRRRHRCTLRVEEGGRENLLAWRARRAQGTSAFADVYRDWDNTGTEAFKEFPMEHHETTGSTTWLAITPTSFREDRMESNVFRWMLHWASLLIHRMTVDDMFAYAAALAYNFLFALFPLLLFLSALLGFLHLSPNVREVFRGPLSQLLPGSLLTFITNAWRQLILTRHPTLLSLGALGFLSGMAAAFRQLIEALNHAYEFPMPRRRPLWKSYALSLAAGLTVGLVIALAIFLSAVSSSFLRSVVTIALSVSIPATVLIGLRWLGLIVLLWATLSAIYTILPDRPRPLRLLNPGTLAALGLWLLISLGFSLYTDHFNTYDRIYGSLGAMILLMLYLYFAGMALVMGAEISALTDPEYGHPNDVRSG